MISLSQIPSAELKKLITLATKKEALEWELEALLKRAKKNIPSRPQKKLGVAQPLLRDLIRDILKAAKKPMTTRDIYLGTLKKGYVWKSKNPRNALHVKMAMDWTFEKIRPGLWRVRER